MAGQSCVPQQSLRSKHLSAPECYGCDNSQLLPNWFVIPKDMLVNQPSQIKNMFQPSQIPGKSWFKPARVTTKRQEPGWMMRSTVPSKIANLLMNFGGSQLTQPSRCQVSPFLSGTCAHPMVHELFQQHTPSIEQWGAQQLDAEARCIPSQ